MKKIALLCLLLTGCSDVYKVMMCPNDALGCQKGEIIFDTLEDCEDFVRKASQVQRGITRICVKVSSYDRSY